MIDYDPSKWQSTRMRRCYVYMMQFDEFRTVNALKKLKIRIADRRFYKNPLKKGKRAYWGWIGFDEPLELLDAMECGLVPVFRDKYIKKKEGEKGVDNQS